MKRPSKYRNKRTELDGLKFASKAESQAYAVLKIREKAGEIKYLTVQPSFDLYVPSYGAENGEEIKICTYIADFLFIDCRAGEQRVVDIKGVETPVFKIKRRLMKACYGIDVETWTSKGDYAS